MKNSKTLFQELISIIRINEDKDEVRAIALLIMEKVFNLTRSDIMAEKMIPCTTPVQHRLEGIVERLNSGEPLQYILEEASFFGRIFFVTPAVLIPRPETEELTRLVIDHIRLLSNPKVLDIGTGSGCIAITIALENPGATVSATDISQDALKVAGINSERLLAKVDFHVHDILSEDLTFKNIDVVVSNPPYISAMEKNSMRSSVYDHEPSLALFVEEKDPLIFYRTIAEKASAILKSGGLLAFEINERFGKQVAELVLANGFVNVKVTADLFGKERIVTGILK